MSTPTQPSPGAMSAAREILDAVGFSYSAAGVFARTQEPIVAAIIDRHTARPDVDELVKALENLFWDCTPLVDGNKHADAKGVSMPTRQTVDAAWDALTRHRERAQNGGGL